MEFLFLDDAEQSKCQRPKMGKLFATGGLAVPADDVGQLETALEGICIEHGLPECEVFKWSPSRPDMFRKNFVGDARTAFFIKIIKKCAEHKATCFVAIDDESCKPATFGSVKHELDVLLLVLERFDTHLRNDSGFVIAAKPRGGDKNAKEFLADCVEATTKGTDFVSFKKIALNPVTMPFEHSRVLQAADLIVSITTAMVAGNTNHAEKPFQEIKKILKQDRRGLIGGCGVKIHPSLKYRNLYHWLLGDEHFPESSGSATISLPQQGKPFSNSPLIY